MCSPHRGGGMCVSPCRCVGISVFPISLWWYVCVPRVQVLGVCVCSPMFWWYIVCVYSSHCGGGGMCIFPKLWWWYVCIPHIVVVVVCVCSPRRSKTWLPPIVMALRRFCPQHHQSITDFIWRMRMHPLLV